MGRPKNNSNILIIKELAERVGFEPTLEFPLNTLSKRAPSATRPSLRGINTLALAAASGGNTLMSFTSFLKEKQYLENVSTNTLRWYKHALNWLPSESPDEAALKDMVIRMREKGLNVLAQREMEKGRSSLVHRFRPFGAGIF
jgi:hypothetical protein